MLPVDNKLALWLNNLQRRNFPVWTGAAITVAIALIIEFCRRGGIMLPVPFLLLIVAVSSSASLGGVAAGLWSHLVWSIFIVYAAIVGFGPKTLTGGTVELFLGITVIGIFAVVQGWTKEQNRWLTRMLIYQNHRLELEVANRTDELVVANNNLKQEIKERIASEEALSINEQKFRAIFEQAEVGITVAGLDKKLLQVNPKFCQFIGYSAEELRSLTFQQISHPDESASDCHHVNLMKKREVNSLTKEKRYIKKNGSIVWGNITATVVKNAQQQPNYFITIIQDITKRKQAELALEESENRFIGLLNVCPFLVWISGVDGLCNFFNTAWLDFTGRTLEQELGLGWSEGSTSRRSRFLPPDLRNCLCPTRKIQNGISSPPA